MLKKLVSISLILCIVGSLFGFVLPLSWYVTNYHHIANELCINRLNPNIECNGSCQLKKRMDKQHDHDKEKSSNTTKRGFRVDLHHTITSSVLSRTPDKSISYRRNNHSLSTIWFSEPTSPPPQLS